MALVSSTTESTATENGEFELKDYSDVEGFDNTNNHTYEYEDGEHVESNEYNDELPDEELSEDELEDEEQLQEENVEAEEQIPLHVCLLALEIMPKRKKKPYLHYCYHYLFIFGLSHAEIRNHHRQQ